MEGHFSVQLAGGSPFRRILVDQTMDVSFNKDTKTSTGIMTRFSLKTGAVNRFYLTAEYRWVCFSRSAEEFSTSKVTSISPR